MLAVRHARPRRGGRAGQPNVAQELARRLAQSRDPFGGCQNRKLCGSVACTASDTLPSADEAREDAGDLERSRKAEPRALGGRQVRDVAPGEADAAGVRPEFAGQLPDQRGLAGTIRPDQRVGFAGADIERDVVGRDQRAERLYASRRSPAGIRSWARSRAWTSAARSAREIDLRVARRCRPRRSRAAACPRCRPASAARARPAAARRTASNARCSPTARRGRPERTRRRGSGRSTNWPSPGSPSPAVRRTVASSAPPD